MHWSDVRIALQQLDDAVVPRVRWRLWRLRRRLGWAAVVTLPSLGGLRLVLPAWSDGRAAALYVDRKRASPDPELAWLATMLRPGEIAVDVGAHLGEWTVVLATTVGSSGRVIAVEPARATWAALKRTIALNALEHVHPVHVALADEVGTACLHHDDRHPTMHSLGPVGESGEIVEVWTLDYLLSAMKIGRLDALKLDVEGAEERVLRGAWQSLARFRPVVVFEVNPRAAARQNLAADGAWKILAKLNYRFFAVEEGMLCSLPAFTPPGAGTTARNIIALSIERAHAVTRNVSMF